MRDRDAQRRAFLKVVETGSFTAAAEALGWSKAKVSKAVAALEKWLGCQLLKRTTRSVEPTADGMAYNEQTKSHMHAIEQVEAALLEKNSRSSK